jgi:uncharacterized membrane protein
MAFFWIITVVAAVVVVAAGAAEAFTDAAATDNIASDIANTLVIAFFFILNHISHPITDGNLIKIAAHG